MDKEDFYAAQVLENDGWTYEGTSDGGDLMFTRIMGGITYGIDLRKDR